MEDKSPRRIDIVMKHSRQGEANSVAGSGNNQRRAGIKYSRLKRYQVEICIEGFKIVIYFLGI